MKDEKLKEVTRVMYVGCMGYIIAFAAIFIVFVIISLFSSCRTKFVPVEHTIKETVEVIDTVKEIRLVPYKDSIVTKDTTSYLFNEYAFSYAMWSGGMLHHSLGIFFNKPILIEVPKTILIKREEKIPQIVKVEKELNRWQRFKEDYSIPIIVVLSFIIWWLIRIRK